MSGLFPAVIVKSHVFILQFPSIRWVGEYFLSPTDLPGYDFSGGGRVDNSVNVHPNLVQGQQHYINIK